MLSLRFALYVCLVAVGYSVVFDGSASAAAEKTLHAFTDGSDGGSPYGGLIADSQGNLYGTAQDGGTLGYGTVYKLTRTASGWTGTTLYDFQGGTNDGASPGNNLAFDSAGNLYGITFQGGIGWNNPAVRGWGTVFMLTPSGSKWAEKVIHFFAANYRPSSGLVIDKTGDMFGETGGAANGPGGTIYGMRNGSAGWEFQTLFDFAGSGSSFPVGGLFDNAGNLYGVAGNGGASCCGTVFELKRGANNSWTESVLYSFTGLSDGGGPAGPLVSNATGKLYGATAFGGDLSCQDGSGCGVAFELALSAGVWTETVLHTFTNSPDGDAPGAGMVFDKSGNLYGTTAAGGADGYGTVFELSPQSGGEWNETVLFSFTNSDGADPTAPLLLGLGNIYGTAYAGGEFGWGVVFELPAGQ